MLYLVDIFVNKMYKSKIYVTDLNTKTYALIIMKPCILNGSITLKKGNHNE